jgi:cell division protein FtsZ
MSQAAYLEHYAHIKVVGVGGGGGNAVTRMIEAGVGGVEFICMNTDSQVLELSISPHRLQIGDALTKGLGAGGNPEVGRQAAEESRQDIKKMLEGADMVFITAGMGGGTGTGAAPIIAEIARDMNALTVGVVTKPFNFEGPRRLRLAEEGIAQFRSRVDTIITIPNDRLLNVAEKRKTLLEAFQMADDVLRQGVQGVSDIITVPGMINVDFADVKAIMTNAGSAIMGIGQARGDNRALEAAEMAVSSPLLETTIDGARRVLLNITAGPDITLEEMYQAADVIARCTDAEDAQLIMGAVIDENMLQDIRVTVLATGFGPDIERVPVQSVPAEKALPQSPRPVRPGINPGTPAKAVDLDLPAFLQQKNRPQP